jgi:O-acetyl-ADP-ribose deacetylase
MDVETIAIVCAGPLGREIAYAAALAGYRIILEDNWPTALDEGAAWIKNALNEEIQRGRIDQETRDIALGRLTTAPSPEAASREADLIVETAVDELEVKLELFTIFDKFAKPGAIFASTTSSLSITDIAGITFCPERCVGMRFSNSAPGNRLLKLVRGQDTSEETVAACREVGRRMGMRIVVLYDSAGLVTGLEPGDYNRKSAAGADQEHVQIVGGTMTKPLKERIVIQQGDLTEMDTDAIVNAANNDLQLGGGVAGAIRRKGGEGIQRECDAIGSIPIGYAAITGGGKLKARHVIHAASMRLGGRTTADALRHSAAHTLRIAAERGLKTIAFPAVGTGIAGFPMDECAAIMLREAMQHMKGETSLETIYFVLFDESACDVFTRAWKELQKEAAGAKSA